MMQPQFEPAISYFRVSTSPQDATGSKESQFERVEGYLLKENLKVIRSFQDTGSGLSIKERANFIKAVDFACDPANGIRHMVFDEMSRFTRSPRDYFPYMDRLEKAGITLHSVLEGAKIGPDCEFTWGMICLNNERSSRLTSFKTKNNQREAIKRGQTIATKAPYGYMWESVEKEISTPFRKRIIVQRRLVKNPEEWPHLLKIFSMALNGDSPMAVARELNLLGISGPAGREWSDRTVRYILRNPHYLGRPYRGINPKSKLPGRQEPMEPTYGPHTHEPAVSEEEFDLIGRMIQARTRTAGPTRCHSSMNILSGIVKCGLCKLADHDSNLIIHRDKPGGIIRLRCSRKKSQGKGACSSKPIRMDALTGLVLERLMTHTLTEPVLRQLIEDVARDSREYLAEGEERKRELSRELSEVRKRTQNLSEVIQTQGARYQGLATLLGDLVELEAKEQTLQEAIQEINDATEQGRLFINDPDGIMEAVLDLRTYTDTRDDKAAKELISLFVSSVYVYKDAKEENDNENHMEIHYTLPVHSKKTSESLESEIVVLKRDQDDDRDDDFCLLGTPMGMNRGRYFLLTGQMLDAEQARELGLVAEVLPPAELVPRAWALARQLAQQPRLVLRYSRALLTHKLKQELHDLLGYGLALEGLGSAQDYLDRGQGR